MNSTITLSGGSSFTQHAHAHSFSIVIPPLFSSTSTTPSNNSTGFGTDATVYGIDEVLFLAVQYQFLQSTLHPLVAPISFLRLVSSLGSDIPARSKEAVVMEQQLTTGAHDARNAPLPSDMYAPLARCRKLNISSNILKNQTAIKEQSSRQQLYWLEIERIRLVNNRRVGSAFDASQKGLFQVPFSVPCDSFCLTNSFKAQFLTVLAR